MTGRRSVGGVRNPYGVGVAMFRYVLTGIVLVTATVTTAGPASAFRECDAGDTQCYEQCYLPVIEKGHLPYWRAC